MKKIAIFITILLLMSCAVSEFSIRENFSIPKPIPVKLPLNAGIYLTSELCNFKAIEEQRHYKELYLFGESICYGIKKMSDNIFIEKTMLTDTININSNIDVIIIPKVVQSDVIQLGMKEKIRILLRIKYSIIDNNKKVLWIDTYQGEGINKWRKSFFLFLFICPPLFYYDAYVKGKEDIETCLRMALEDHFINASQGILSSRFWEIRK